MSKRTELFRRIDTHGGDRAVCWEWRGKVNPTDGRPYVTFDGVRHLAYRVAYELVHGPGSLDGYVGRHTCDNKVCCNPWHLVPGDHQANMQDMRERDRHGLPALAVRNIRKLLAAGRTQQEIADLYGCSREAISAIATGRNKAHVEGEQS